MAKLERYLPCAVSALGMMDPNKWPKYTMVDMNSPWYNQYQKNFTATSPLSKPTIQKYGITKKMDDTRR